MARLTGLRNSLLALWLLVCPTLAWAGDVTISASGGSGDVTDVNEGTAIDVTNPTGPAPSVAWDSTEINDTTFGDGTDAELVWTANPIGTDPVLGLASNALATITGTLRVSSQVELGGVLSCTGALQTTAAGRVFCGTAASSLGSTIDDTELTAEDFGDFTASGAEDGVTIDANAVALSTDTTGDYVAAVADGTGIDGTASGEGSTYTPTIDTTELNDLTWGNASESALLWTADTSSASDATLEFSANALATVTGTVRASAQVEVGTLAQSNCDVKATTFGRLVCGADSGAPTDAEYLVSAANGTLSAEDLVTEGLAIDYSNGAGTGTFAFDPTELTGDRTFSDASTATANWTWDLGTATDPVLIAGNASLTSNAAFVVTGTASVKGPRLTANSFGDLQADTCMLLGNGLVCEGNTADTFETRIGLAGVGMTSDINLSVPLAASDTTLILASDSTQVTDLDSTGLAISSGSLQFSATELNDLTWGDGTDGEIVWTPNTTASSEATLAYAPNALLTVTGTARVSSQFEVGSLTASACDVKATTFGRLFCGADATGEAGSGDLTDVNEGTYIDVTSPTGPAPTVSVDATEIEAVTFGAGGNASNVWTVDLSGTDPTLTWGSASATLAGSFTATDVTATRTVTGVNVVATSTLTLPNGTSPILGDVGMTAVDTTSGQVVTVTGTGAHVLPYEQTKCFTVENLVAADDNKPVYVFEDAADLKRTRCYAQGFTTVPTYQFEDGDGNAVTGAAPCAPTNQAEWTVFTLGNTVARGETLRLDTTNTPAPTSGTETTICFVYEQTRR